MPYNFLKNITLLAAICLLINGCDQQQGSSAGVAVEQPEITQVIPAQADITLLINARIYTANTDQPMVTAMAFNDQGAILAVGERLQLEADYPNARQLDIGDRGIIIPGMIDAHAHLMNLGYSVITTNLAGTRSRAEILQRLQQNAAQLSPGSWLVGRGWDQNDWIDHDGSFPSSSDLDELFPQRPVWLTRIDGHAGWANSSALALVADGQLDSEPEGGRIIRDQDSQPTGVFVDAAMQLVASLIPAPDHQTEQLALQQALAETSRHGLTGVHEAGTSLQHLRLYQEAIANEQFPVRLYAMANGQAEALNHLCQQGVLEHDSGLLIARSVKFYLDGALGSRGAALVEDYSDESGHRGLLFVQPQQFAQQVTAAMRCGLQINTHAIGDHANQVLIDAYANAMQAVPAHVGRHRIEHAQVMRADGFQRSADLNLIASVQPTHATSDMYWAEDRVGPQRIQYAYAWQDFLNAGVKLALGSDFPVESVNPLLGFYAAVSRQDTDNWPTDGWYPQQQLSREQALHGFTLGAAYAAFMENEVGSLEPGKRADFVWLSQDIMQIPASEIPQTSVLETWLNGKRIFDQNQ